MTEESAELERKTERTCSIKYCEEAVFENGYCKSCNIKANLQFKKGKTLSTELSEAFIQTRMKKTKNPFTKAKYKKHLKSFMKEQSKFSSPIEFPATDIKYNEDSFYLKFGDIGIGMSVKDSDVVLVIMGHEITLDKERKSITFKQW